MSNLINHAKLELEKAGLFDKDGDYDGMIGEAVLELITVFSKQGHSGCSASLVSDIFNKLSRFKPLTPLTFEDDEWNEIGENQYQNKRNSSVFKEGKDGRPYTIDAYYKQDQNGNTWNGSLSVGGGKRVARCYIKDPMNIPKIKIFTLDWEVNKEDESIKEPGSGWWKHQMLYPQQQLKELETYYDVEYIDED